MARPTTQLVSLLRQTANRIADAKTRYQWSSFAHCNCGHLAQTLTGMDPSEIEQKRGAQAGDWGQQARDLAAPHVRFHPDFGDRPALDEGAWEPENIGSCSVSGRPLDELFEQLYEVGLSPQDIGHLERLSDPAVRRHLGANTIRFNCFERQNVVRYMRAWASILEEQLLAEHPQATIFAAAE